MGPREGAKRIENLDFAEGVFTTHDVGLDPNDWFGLGFAAGPDGTIWTDTYDGRPLPWANLGNVFTGLASYDGQGWTTAEYGGRAMDVAERLADAPDGTVWVAGFDIDLDPRVQRLVVLRWDGQSWEMFGPVDASPLWGSRVEIDFVPDGTVWTVLIDMKNPKELGCQVQPSQCEGVPALYVITPEAVAAIE